MEFLKIILLAEFQAVMGLFLFSQNVIKYYYNFTMLYIVTTIEIYVQGGEGAKKP